MPMDALHPCACWQHSLNSVNKKKEHVCLGGKSAEGMLERVGEEEVGGRFAQNTLYTCMKFYT